MEMKALNIINSLKAFDALKDAGAEIFLVGGIVRDHFIQRESKDIDLIVRLLDRDVIVSTLKPFGHVKAEVGQLFGTTSFKPKEIKLNDSIDIALPRIDSLEDASKGHHGIKAEFDKNLTIEQDLERRDFSINSIAMTLDGEIIDPFNGMKDLEAGIIRATSKKAFSEDPLRMMRAIQFAARFGFEIEEETWNMIVENVDTIKTIPGERIAEELSKILKKGDPELGLKLFVDSGLHKAVFGFNKMVHQPLASSVKTIADFFFIVCGDSTNFKVRLRGVNDHKGLDREIEAVSQLIKVDISKPKKELRWSVFNAIKRSETVLGSGLFSDSPIQEVIDEFNDGILPKKTSELAVGGAEMLARGLDGPEIGKLQRKLLDDIFSEKRKNNFDDLITDW
jgi:tRNA nucleotidyltransferase/poly(A) polymerase